jgi:hypothetical protein
VPQRDDPGRQGLVPAAVRVEDIGQRGGVDGAEALGQPRQVGVRRR